MTEKIQLDDIVSRVEVPAGVDQITAVIADTDPSVLNKAILESLDNYHESSGLGTIDNRVYGVQYAANIHHARKTLSRPMRRAATIICSVTMGGSMYLGIQEMRDVQQLARYNVPQEVAARDSGISDETIDRASIFFGTLGLFSGILAGRMFGGMVEETEARRRARRQIEKAQQETR